MKCIKAVKSTKYSEVGEIKRVSNAEAEEKVETGYWVYVPKSEYKLSPSLKEVVKDDSPSVEKPKREPKEKKQTESKTKKTKK